MFRENKEILKCNWCQKESKYVKQYSIGRWCPDCFKTL